MRLAPTLTRARRDRGAEIDAPSIGELLLSAVVELGGSLAELFAFTG